jgi:hypothetical protein
MNPEYPKSIAEQPVPVSPIEFREERKKKATGRIRSPRKPAAGDASSTMTRGEQPIPPRDMGSGFVAVPRWWINSPEWHQLKAVHRGVILQLFFHIARKPVRHRVTARWVERGQWIESCRALALASGATIPETRRAIEHAEKRAWLARENITAQTPKGTIHISLITWLDFDSYDSPKSAARKSPRKPARKSPRKRIPILNTREENPTRIPCDGDRFGVSSEEKNEEPEGFKTFWNNYPPGPHKKNRRYSAKIWQEHHLEDLKRSILAGLQSWKEDDQWHRDNGAYIKWPQNFLMDRLWEDRVNRKPIAQDTIFDRFWEAFPAKDGKDEQREQCRELFDQRRLHNDPDGLRDAFKNHPPKILPLDWLREMIDKRKIEPDRPRFFRAYF